MTRVRIGCLLDVRMVFVVAICSLSSQVGGYSFEVGVFWRT